MVKHTNFYENIKEAGMRLVNTIVVYDNEPFYVLCIDDHMKDGIFRIYLDPVPDKEDLMAHQKYSMPFQSWDFAKHKTVGPAMDEWLETADGKRSGVLRKMMNSPKFNNYRPFSLGMVNMSDRVYYCRRQPTRHTQQGLTQTMLNVSPVSLTASSAEEALAPYRGRGANVSITSYQLGDAIRNIYPDYKEVITNLNDDQVANQACAFHREFAAVRGPLNLLFLAYKDEIVGLLDGESGDKLVLEKRYSYVKEVAETTGVFSTITVKN